MLISFSLLLFEGLFRERIIALYMIVRLTVSVVKDLIWISFPIEFSRKDCF